MRQNRAIHLDGGIARNIQVPPARVLQSYGVEQGSDVAEVIVYAIGKHAQVVSLVPDGLRRSLIWEQAIENVTAC